MSSVTAYGYEADDLATIYADLVAQMQAIFPDGDFDPDTIDGQTLGIFAESKWNVDQLAQDVYDSWNPQSATGVSLSRVVQYNGIKRIPGIRSTGAVTCGGTAGTHIPINSLIAGITNQEQWYTIQDAYVGITGQVDVSVLSVNVGAIQAPVGTLNQILTPVYGWQTVTNSAAALLGRDEETDAELRLRRAASTATPAQSVPESVYGAVANIPGVIQVRLYENYMETTDPGTGLPPHSFSVVVQGGLDMDIAAAIWNRASIGATQVGSTTVTLYDIQGFPHTIYFQRPVVLRVYVSVQVKPLPGWGDQLMALIQVNMAAWAAENWQIGDEIIYSRLYEPLNDMPPVFSVTSLTVGTAPNPTGKADITIPYASIATLQSTDVVVTKTP